MGVGSTGALGRLVGTGASLGAVRRFIERAARTDVPVLVTGETGTGKSLVARIIHDEGPRGSSPFCTVNCSGIPEGLFESELFGHRRGAFTGALEQRSGLFQQADGGSLFLDEVGELPPGQQAKLLTAIEDGEVRRVGDDRARPVDVRIICATSRDLGADLAAGTFRRDLFHRVAVLACPLPPLRSRPADIPLLARHFLRRSARRHGHPEPRLSTEAYAVLAAHGWPGNLRELAHVIEAAVIVSGGAVLTADRVREVLDPVGALGRGVRVRTAQRAGGGGGGGNRSVGPVAPPGPSGGGAVPENPGAVRPRGRYSFHGTAEEERERIREALVHNRGNRTRTARELGMARNTLRRKVRDYGL